ncbi:methyltransferase [Catellatospora sp. TT07R-123]|uniref:class I SAM-dependent methyltransferase n=1 Tax=Catellatospora sp. TT07R-123 TaxID=2733863 RepID=UPI001AFD0C96|nr:class I SAM-dependent methyltransferase [Catellatospora sp. TT07R-123]GHJ46806.1 methyltransferase [Catellatospora sp. TT07R-123]
MTGPTWKLFDRIAADYDQVAPFFAEYGTAIVAAIDPPSGCRFLDLGCGRGALTAAALARGCAVTAVDAAPAMVAQLAAAYPQVEARVMDAQALALPDASFDLVASSFVVHLVDDPAAAVGEAYRVLAPGGRLAITGGSARSRGGSPHDPTALGSRLDALFIEFSGHLAPGSEFGRPIDAAELLEQAGFVDLREDQAGVAIPFADTATLWQWAMSHGYRAFVEALPDEHRERFHRGVLALSDGDLVLRRTTPIWSGRRPD